MKIESKLGIKGEYKVTECDSSSLEAKRFIAKMKLKTGKAFNDMLKEFHTLFSIREEIFYNIVPNVGLNALAENIINTTPPASQSLRISYGGLGTGTGTPTGADTILGNEEYRQTVSSQVRVTNKAYNTVFLDNNSGNGFTYSEFGLFSGEATATADSGTLFSRVLLSPTFEKTSAKTLTIEAMHTFTSA